jgi:hypothetical protein
VALSRAYTFSATPARTRISSVGRVQRALDDAVVLRKIWVLRLRALLAGARGDEAAHHDFHQQYRAMVRSLGWLRHMAMADSWAFRVAAAGASRILSTSAKMSRKPMWNKVIQWSTAPKRRR